ncbi:DUF4276 family protein [Curtobacterium sp. KBS0715]|uniref:DUF4276 family protein n=1 Tax=Curtobacterium sp. KBS0715 TaxID=1179671 RepID=UPI00110ED328|nr:DUF4276 family protein [Curtobacterium sp. KBS0715]TSD10689.1 hypothetical protein FFG40_003480 [Curtobacterium sp. KBS0715]
MARKGAVQLIVEGPGDHGAVRVLLQRYLHEVSDFRPNMLGAPIAANGLSNLTKPGGIEGFVRIASAREGAQVVVIVADSDKECIKERAEDLLPRAAGRLPVLLALAERNFEDWIYASAETTLDAGMTYTPGANGLAQIKASQRYTKSVDQAKLASRIDFALAASRSQSFARLVARFESTRKTLVDPT